MVGGITWTRWGVLFCALAMQAAAEDNWPIWRGPSQAGITTSDNLPITWSETENIVWKTPLPSWSGSTPIIWGDRIYLTSPSKPAPDMADPVAGGVDLLLLCLDKQDGRIVWETQLDTGNAFHFKQNDASPSPVTDGVHIWTMTGTGTASALDMEGKILWKRNLQTDYGPFGMQFGYACSPVLYKNTLIFQVLHGFTTQAPSYLVALDALTGEERWRVERPTEAIRESRDSYATPLLYTPASGPAQIILVGGDCVTGSDASTGAEIWRMGGLNPRASVRNRIIVCPVAAEGVIYAASAKNPLMAILPDGQGDVTSSKLLWNYDEPNVPDVPSLICDGAYLYMVDDGGKATCLNAKTGQVVWGPERTARGMVSASPIASPKHLYIINEDGVTTVLARGPEFRIEATNTLPSEGRSYSSPVVSGNHLFIRTDTSLYCIGSSAKLPAHVITVNVLEKNVETSPAP